MVGVTYDINKLCAVCGAVIEKIPAIQIRVNINDDSEFRKVKETFGKVNFDICICCWILSLGVKPKNSITELEKKDE